MVRYTHPEMFYMFAFFFIIIIWYFYEGKKLNSNLDKLGIYPIKKFLFNRARFSRISFRSFLFFFGSFFIILASTGPQIGTKLTELNRKGIDLIILMDTSSSMDATDVKPSRIEKAKYELGRLINFLEGDRVGLIAFAGSAHLHCPLTEDYSAAKLFLNSINTKLISNQGTDVADAIRLALDRIKHEDEKYKVIILVSDGEDHQGEAINLTEQARELGIIIHTLGIGTVSGGLIPIYSENGNRKEFKKNRNGQIITSTLNESMLNEISDKTGGTYIRVTNQINAIEPILKEIKQMEKKEIKSHVFSQYEDRYQIFLLISLFFLFIEFIMPTRTKKEISWKGRFSQLD